MAKEKKTKSKSAKADSIKENKSEIKTEKPKSHAFSKESKSVILVLVIALVFVGFALTINYLRTRSNIIDYRGVDFAMEKTGRLVLYHTQIPYYAKDSKIKYNFWIRNNPKVLEKNIEFEGKMYVRQIIVLNMTGSDFQCDGDGIIAIANLKQLYEVLGAQVVIDPTATCETEYPETPRYVYVNIQAGEKSWIEQVSKACYTIHVKDCEILPATERYMTETFVAMKDYK